MRKWKWQLNHAQLFGLSLATAVSFFIVNTTGFVDTMTDSTEGCGKSWPLCHGSIMPWNWDYHAWIEFGHRFLVFTASVLLFALSIAAWRMLGQYRRVRTMIAAAVCGVVLESLLGALSVFAINPPVLMAAHMGVALLSFGALAVLTVTIRQLGGAVSSIAEERAGVSRNLSRLIWFTLIFLYLAIYFGSYVASTGTGAFFRGFPFPTESYDFGRNALWIDIGHRTFAIGLLVLTVVLTLWTRRIKSQRPDLYLASVCSLALVCLQGVSGALLIYTHLSFASILLHVTTVSLLFADLCVMSVQCMASPQPRVAKTRSQPARLKHAAGHI